LRLLCVVDDSNDGVALVLLWRSRCSCVHLPHRGVIVWACKNGESCRRSRFWHQAGLHAWPLEDILPDVDGQAIVCQAARQQAADIDCSRTRLGLATHTRQDSEGISTASRFINGGLCRPLSSEKSRLSRGTSIAVSSPRDQRGYETAIFCRSASNAVYSFRQRLLQSSVSTQLAK
jgi:hypothetical protein